MTTDEHHNATVLVRGDITVNDIGADAVLAAFILARLVCASLPRGAARRSWRGHKALLPKRRGKLHAVEARP